MAEEYRPIRVTEQQGKQVAGSDGSVPAVVGASEQGAGRIPGSFYEASVGGANAEAAHSRAVMP